MQITPCTCPVQLRWRAGSGPSVAEAAAVEAVAVEVAAVAAVVEAAAAEVEAVAAANAT